MESYDPFRSPFNRVPEKSPQCARVTIHRDAPETSPKPASPDVGSSNPFLDNEHDIECQQSPPFTIVRKKKQKVESVRSFQSKASLPGSKRVLNPASTPRSASYKRNVTFRHNRNRSQSSASMNRTKRPFYTRQASEGSLPSAYGGDPFSDFPSSPTLPAQPAVVRGAGVAVKHGGQRRVYHSDFTWRDDARKVSHELSQICEEAFNGSSISTGCTDATCVGSETPATSVSIGSPGASIYQSEESNSTVCLTAQAAANDSPKSTHASKELKETRRRLIEHSTKDGSKDLPGYLATVINHLDRLIEQEKSQPERAKSEEGDTAMSDLLSRSSAEPTQLSMISEELNSAEKAEAAAKDEKARKFSKSTAASSRRSDISQGKRSIRMVPSSSHQSIGKVEPLTISKTRTATQPNLAGIERTGQSIPAPQAVSNPKHTRTPCELDPIDEHPASPRRSVARHSDHKKWSWFRKSQNIEGDMTKAPRVVKPLHPSSATVIVHEVRPAAETQDQPRLRKPESGTQKSSFWRFMKRKTSKKSGKTAKPIESLLH